VRTVVVTGSSSGLGRATKELLEADGVRVIGVDVADADVGVDLSNAAGRAEAALAIAELCDGTVDGFVGYAGVGPTVADIALLTSVNYFGQIDLLLAVKPLLAAAVKPVVVVVSSIAPMVSESDEDSVAAMLAGDEERAIALTVKHDDHSVAYSSSKLATLKFGRKLAVEWIAEGIRVNVLAPGNTTTPMTEAALADPELGPVMRGIPVPVGQWADPTDVAEAARWLLSDRSRYVVGSLLVVDGGIDALARPDTFSSQTVER
jgi:NAD(P)-dependent dehydrogenase (short-subunit alcohol dehydrogenase family)